MWNLATGSMLFDLDSHTTQINGVAFSPDAHLLATTGNDAGSVSGTPDPGVN